MAAAATGITLGGSGRVSPSSSVGPHPVKPPAASMPGICALKSAMSAGLLVIEIPTGRSADCRDVMALQETLNDAVGALLDFYSCKTPAGEVLARITAGMEGLAFHRENVRKHDQPELDL